ncbi:polycystin-1-like protein 3 [Centropristis striata]|uniref:polycystin-1-like protein 3 n=1 Tax=Centropristis striata TaxID=184440 RepID=UPI0027DF4D39|nr:polycystin-1-like protein 3 [Centropristis striata]
MEMRFEMKLAFCVLVVLTGSSQTGGQSSALPPILTPTAIPSHAGASPDLTENPANEVSQRTYSPAGGHETSTETTTITKTKVTIHSENATNAEYKTHLLTSAVPTSQHMDVPVVMTTHPAAPSPSAAADGLLSTPTVQSATPPQHISASDGRATLTTDPLTTFSSQPAHTVQDTSSTAHASTIQSQSESPATAITQPTTTGYPLTSAPGRGPAGPTHREVASELNVGDEDLKGPRRSSSPLDPLLAGLLSVFIVTTAIVFVVLFLKFRQRTNHPEFHRLQDLPMDDLMEDTPLSRYTY